MSVAGVTCPACGKVGYRSKSEAKAASKQLEQRGRRNGRIHPYRCGDLWHLGHLPKSVVAGQITRDRLGPAKPRTRGPSFGTEFEINSRRRNERR